jgi:hypothetical protein
MHLKHNIFVEPRNYSNTVELSLMDFKTKHRKTLNAGDLMLG